MSVALKDADQPAADAGFWSRLDRWLERCGERLNPILVKEARQALKSKQFVVTFTLLLACGWGWSLFGVAVLSPGIYYAPSGPFMLIGYAIVLTVPLLLIVPFATYRSLAAEREDGTYELLSITSLSSRQIVSGKLWSSVLQMIVYYSALSPCIAFTYLLRGVDIITILLFLFYTFLASLILCAVALMMATVAYVRHLQVLLTVALLIGLLIATIGWCIWAAQAIGAMPSIPYDDADFWIAQVALLTGYFSYFILFVLAGAAQLSFASDNRSTRLRVVMLAQQALFLGWMMYYWLTEHASEILFIVVTLSAIHWMAMGALMTGELAQLSPRVKRRLPQSFLGRSFMTWFNPGSGTGYVFAVVNLLSVVLVVIVAGVVAHFAGLPGAGDQAELVLFGLMACAYLAAYLGAGRLLVLALRRYLHFGLLLPLLIHALLLFLGAALPAFFQAWIFGFDRFDDYTALQVTNWLWTLAEVVDGNILAAPEVLALVSLAAAGIFLVNLIVAAREVEQVRQETPDVVLRDELARRSMAPNHAIP